MSNVNAANQTDHQLTVALPSATSQSALGDTNREEPDRTPPAVADMEAFLGMATLERSPDVKPTRTAAVSAPQIEGYEILSELGRGGMGIVYRARDTALDRDVAIKLLREPCPSDSSIAHRFVDEARITGQLQHPGIPPVHQIGVSPDGRPFLAMKLIKGRTLDRLLAEPEARSGQNWLAVFEAICQAVGYAHAHGVIHRDLKPQNIMVGSFGEVQVMDWGLAKLLSQTAAPAEETDQTPEKTRTEILTRRDGDSQTQAGDIMGTLAFMSPEQAAGENERVDQRSDVFALGAILCVILTGEPPYRGAKDLASLRLLAIRGKLEDAFRRLDASGPEPELIALAKRCLSFEPSSRPADGSAVAAAVAELRASAERRARAAETERAKAEVKAAEQRKRRKVQLALAASIGFLFVGGAAGALFYTHRMGIAEGDKHAAETERRAAQQEQRIAQDLARAADGREKEQRYYSRLNAAREIIERRQLGWGTEAMPLLEEAAAIETSARDPVGLRSAIAACLTGVDLRDPKSVAPGMVPGTLAFGPSPRSLLAIGQFRALALSPLAVQVVDVANGQIVWNFKVLSAPVWEKGLVPDGINALAFSPDNRWLVAGTRSGNVFRWDLKSDAPEAVRLPVSHARSVLRLAFDAAGKALYSAGLDGKLLRWDIAGDWKQSGTFTSPRAVDDVAALPDGGIVATTHSKVMFLNPTTLASTAEPMEVDGANLFTVRPDGMALALKMGRRVGIVALPQKPSFVRLLRDPLSDNLSESYLGELQFSPDRVLLVTSAHSDDDRRLKIWDTANGRLQGTLFVPGTGDISPCFSADGQRLAIISGRKTLVYRVTLSRLVTDVAVDSRPIRAFDWSPDGREIAIVAADDNYNGRFAIFRIADGTVRHQVPFGRRPGDAVPNVTWAPKGLIAWIDESASLSITQTTPKSATHVHERIEPRVLVFDPRGRLWGAIGSRMLCWQVDPDTGSISPGEIMWDNSLGDIFRGTGGINDIAVGSSRRIVVTRDGGFYAFDENQKSPAASWMTNSDPLQAVAMSRDESIAIAVSRGGQLYIHDLKAQKKLHEMKAAADSLDAVDIAPDGKIFATGSRDGALKLWRWYGQPELLLTISWPTPIRKLRFSSDGKSLAALHRGESAVRVWNLDFLKQQLAADGLAW